MPAWKKNVRPEFTPQDNPGNREIFFVHRSARSKLSDFWADLEGVDKTCLYIYILYRYTGILSKTML